jgi:hypothetical protein
LPDQTVITETSKIAEMIPITKWAVIDGALKREGHPLVALPTEYHFLGFLEGWTFGTLAAPGA